MAESGFEGVRGGFYLVGTVESWGKTPAKDGWPEGYRLRVDVGGIEPETVTCDYSEAERLGATALTPGFSVVLAVAPRAGRNGLFLSLRRVEGYSAPLTAAAANGASSARAASAA